MMSGMAVFMVAIGGTSLICYLLMNRVQNRKAQRESAGDGAYSGIGGGSDSSSSNGWNLFSWSSSESSSSHDSASSGESGGGGDGGGGGGN
jgi:hypothetical protein